MQRILFVTLTVVLGFGLAACGEDGSTPSVESAGEALEGLGEAAKEAAADADAAAEALAQRARENAEALKEKAANALSADGQSCLDLVQAGSFSQAVPVCLSASNADPENADLREALETARSKAAQAATDGEGALQELGGKLGE